MKLLKKIKLFLNGNKNVPPYINSTVEIPEASDKIKIVPVGYFPAHHDGAHEVTRQNIIEMANNIKNSGTDVLFDYGHESLYNSKALAAGWSPRDSAEAREDGLYIDYPEFTPAAKTHVGGKEFKYFSPAYFLASQDKSGKNIGATLHSIALVNKPYMDKEINHIGNSQINNEVGKMNPKILKFLGLTESAIEAEVEAKLNSLREKHGLQTEASVDDIMNAAEAKLNSSNQAATALEQRIAVLENASSTNQVEALINSAIGDGKILPKERAVYINSAKTDYAGTKAILDGLAKDSAVPQKNSLPTGTTVIVTQPPKYNRAEMLESIKNSTAAAKAKAATN